MAHVTSQMQYTRCFGKTSFLCVPRKRHGYSRAKKSIFDFFMQVAKCNLHAYSGKSRCMAPNHVIPCVNGTKGAIHMQDSKGILHKNSLKRVFTRESKIVSEDNKEHLLSYPYSLHIIFLSFILAVFSMQQDYGFRMP